MIDCIVVNGIYTPILGLEACISLGLIQRFESLVENNLKGSIFHGKLNLNSKYKDVFSGFRQFSRPVFQ